MAGYSPAGIDTARLLPHVLVEYYNRRSGGNVVILCQDTFDPDPVFIAACKKCKQTHKYAGMALVEAINKEMDNFCRLHRHLGGYYLDGEIDTSYINFVNGEGEYATSQTVEQS